jgi:polyisoprenyl-phosphate glycosyltransferase
MLGRDNAALNCSVNCCGTRDSVFGFSVRPVQAISALGFLIAGAGFVYAAVVIFNALVGRPPEGWTSLMVVVLILGGVQMTMLGILGEYLWRALDESRGRPRYIVERRTDAPPPARPMDMSGR